MPIGMLPPAAPVVIVQNDPGGIIGPFVERVIEYKKTGTQVRIRGYCASACTLVTALPSDKVCVEPGATLIFHQPFGLIPGKTLEESVGNRSEVAVRFLMKMYPARLRTWIKQQGGLTVKLIILSGQSLTNLFHECAPRSEPIV